MSWLVNRGVFYSLELLESRRLLSAMSWDGGGDDLHWSDPLNWSGNQVPTVNDDVTVNVTSTHDAIVVGGAQATATLALNGSLVVDSTALFNISRDSTIAGNITLDGGTITGAKLTISSGTFRWTGGKLLGDMFTVNATGKLELAGGDMQLERFVEDSGTTTWTSGRLLLKDHTFESKGTLTVDSNQDVSCQLATGATSGGFLNHNQLIKRGSGTLTIGAANGLYYDNRKTTIEAGTFNLGRIANPPATGQWTVQGTSTLLFPSGLDAGNSITTMIGPDASFPALKSMEHVYGSLQLLDGAVLNSSSFLTVDGQLMIDADSSVHVAQGWGQVPWGTTSINRSGPNSAPAITADGDVHIDGNIWVEFIDGYDPATDTVFPLISGATRSGSTPQFAGAGTPSGRPMGTQFVGGLMSGVVLPRLPMIDLLATSDTGASDTDNTTSDDTPTVRITNLDAGHLDVKNGTTLLASVDVTTDQVLDITLPHLGDGVRTISPTLTSAGGRKSVSDANKLLKITIDTVAPAFSSPAYKPDQAPYPAVTFNFSKDFNLFIHPVLTLRNVDVDQAYPFNLGIVGSAPTGFDPYMLLPATTNGLLPDGNYRLSASAANVIDAAGNQMASDFNFDFFVLTADGNGNRTVDIGDFNLLARNFGRGGMTFSQGNYDRSSDGMITITDFNVLATHYGDSVAAPSPTAASFSIAEPKTFALASRDTDENRVITEIL